MKRRVTITISLAAAFGVGLSGCGVDSPSPGASREGGTVVTPTPAVDPSPAEQGLTLPSNNRPDSYAYYGLGVDEANGGYNASQREGRDTWIMWTAGNQKFFRLGTELAGALGVSVEYFRLLDTRDRATRFERLGLINEPNCVQATAADKFGFWLDEWKGDPYEDAYPDPKIYGEPTGVVGLRKYPNPKFDAASWDPSRDPDRFFRDPDGVEPPYLIGMTCAFCHMGFHPQRPPADPANPRWENLAANLGNQYLHEGGVFFGGGKVVYGDQNGGKGLGPDDFFHQLGESQQRGTSETSRLSYDFINNPNTINSIFNLENRPSFPESYNPTSEAQVRKLFPEPAPLPAIHHVLKDGSDSQGIPIASIRVYVNIGMFGEYWITRLWNPLKPDEPQQPFDMAHAAAESEDWRQTFARMPGLEAYLATYHPMHLEDIPGVVEKGLVIPDRFKDSADAAEKAKWEVVQRGKRVFADNCASCHSSKAKPPAEIAGDPEKVRAFYLEQVLADDFLVNNSLTDDVAYPVSELKTNAGRALATNAIEGHLWEQFSSPEYKARPASGELELYNPADPGQPRKWQPPDGGRGYYRTASLVNIWATAPFLHNNSVGKFPGALGLPASRWASVEGRLLAFEDAIDKMLNPERRDGVGSIKRVSQDTFVYLRLRNIHAVARGVLDELDLGGPLLTPIRSVIEDIKSRVLENLPLPEGVNVGDVPPLKILIPKGMPINLIANLHVSRREEAAKPLIKYIIARKILNELTLPPLTRRLVEGVEREAMDELLAISEYPDLVEDHGHEYAGSLGAEDKAALIEFLKKM